MTIAGANRPRIRSRVSPERPRSTARSTRHEPRTTYRAIRNQPGVGRGTMTVSKRSQNARMIRNRPRAKKTASIGQRSSHAGGPAAGATGGRRRAGSGLEGAAGNGGGPAHERLLSEDAVRWRGGAVPEHERRQVLFLDTLWTRRHRGADDEGRRPCGRVEV